MDTIEITQKPPVLPKRAIAIVGTTDSVAAQGTAQDIAIANTRCPQLECWLLIFACPADAMSR